MINFMSKVALGTIVVMIILYISVLGQMTANAIRESRQVVPLGQRYKYYLVVNDIWETSLTEKVNALVEQGWAPVGGVESGLLYKNQAMVNRKAMLLETGAVGVTKDVLEDFLDKLLR